MKKLFKWPGGKTKELKNITARMPREFNRCVEPFAGSAALSFYLEKPAIINDLDWQIINFYQCLADDWQTLKDKVEEARVLPCLRSDDPFRASTRTLEDAYYDARVRLNSWQLCDDNKMQLAADFYVVRALAFSGMVRYAKDGKFNVPFGWYKSFGNKIDEKSSNLVKTWQMTNSSYESICNSVEANDFIFLDPPYRSRAGYSEGNWTDADHKKFIEWMKGLQNPWMLVHTYDEFYVDDLQSFRIEIIDHQYSQNFKGRDNANSKVQHIYVRNY